MADSLQDRLAAAARAAVDRLFVRSRVRLGLTKAPTGDRRLAVRVDPALTLPGLFRAAAQEYGVTVPLRALDEVRRVAGSYLEAQAATAKAAVTRIVGQIVAGSGGVLTEDVKKDLRESLGSLFERLAVASERIAETEATAARNLGALEGIVAVNSRAGVNDPTVFWITSRDGEVCKECTRLFLLPDGVTPRVWKLSECSRGYHERGAEQPTCPHLHPNCFAEGTILYTEKGMVTVEELHKLGEPVRATVDARVINRRTKVGGRKTGEPILGETWLDRHQEGARTLAATAVFETGKRLCLRIETDDGRSLVVSEDHLLWVDDENMGCRKEARSLSVGDKLPVLSGEGGFGSDHFPELAELMGNLLGDGVLGSPHCIWNFFGNDIEYGRRLMELVRPYSSFNFSESLKVRPSDEKYGVERASFSSTILRRTFVEDFGLSKKPRRVPRRLWRADKETVAAFLRGLYAADGCSQDPVGVVLGQNDLDFLKEIQLLLSNFGLRSRIIKPSPEQMKVITYADGSQHQTHRKPCWRLGLGGWDQVVRFAREIGLGVPEKQKRLEARLAAAEGLSRTGAWRTTRVVSVVSVGEQQTYCLIEPMTHTVTANGLVVGQCRCNMTTLMPGYGFTPDGRVTFKSPDWDEYKHQRG